MRRVYLKFLTLSLALAVGQKVPQSDSPRRAGSIEGVVRDANGQPQQGIKISLKTVDGAFEVITDRGGRYQFSGASVGTCLISTTTEADYLPNSQILNCAEKTTIIDIRLQKAGVIAGRVLDAQKHALAGAIVHVVMEGFANGRTTVRGYSSRVTNSKGEYRITNLWPGQYLVHVAPPPSEFRRLTESESAARQDLQPEISTAITYYGQLPSRLGSPRLKIESGQVQEFVDFVMLESKSVCLSTEVRPPSQRPAGEWIGLTLTELIPQSQSRIAFGRFRDGGIVEVCGLTPGDYRLMAFTQDALGRPLIAVQYPSIAGSKAVRVPSMQFSELHAVTGRITINTDEGQSANGNRSVTIQLNPKDRLRWTGEDLSAKSSREGSFTIPATMVDFYWVDVLGLPNGYYVDKIEANGIDVYTAPFLAGSGDLSVVLGDDGSSVTGTVSDRENRPVSNAVVILVAASSSRRPNQIQTARATADGEFVLTGIPPGDYAIAAFPDVPAGLEGSPEMITEALRGALRLSLAPRAYQTVRVEPRRYPQ